MAKSEQVKMVGSGTSAKIRGLELVNVNGRRYEWNETFSAYWSVNGEPRALQNSDLIGVDVLDGKLVDVADDVLIPVPSRILSSIVDMANSHVEDIESVHYGIRHS